MASRQSPIPQDKIGESFVWRDWFQKLSDRVFGTASTLDVPIQPQYGGTGMTAYNTGDMIYSDSTNHLNRIASPTQKSYLKMTSTGVPAWVPYTYGSFYSTASQSAGAANTVYTANLDTQSVASNMSLSTNSITVTKAGLYNLMFSCQFDNADTSAINEVAMWPAVNGTDVPWSATSTSIPNKHTGVNGYAVIAANFFIDLAVNDVVTMRWVSSSTQCRIFVNSTPPPFTAPYIPGLVVTLQQVAPA